ncbi:bifunctional diaminohydroxyphosphoribosylaminopyrimidine deaminase/5-amino-6-(5-phosphoribosylamino)uracil reductase RibD [Nitrosophilus kaiyonis]|uniref:bifunctional diaminohydroxyphosphoribosylaminopyrimidine deaminase/5-amino-6-(5-phosphoribosylamino)uracil reductase RibD n=1 Tax=Nitrosophilus kaiyonis TaxID=2930200 RepID=UPI002490A4B7|nr:bifunctional diaminohydroxyphosphoribosylaminopyrimidine deaminase/5-amino-6-(5-phosphoribosylamino)uracil reductase RibD [Nitrosophilus kaiyonis]
MDLAINEAWKYQGLTYPNPAVGAVVVKENQILSIGAHKIAGSFHAELAAIKDAYKYLTGDEKVDNIKKPEILHGYLIKNAKNLFENSQIYITLEPCAHYGKTPPCSLLIKNLGFKKVIYAIDDPNKKASGGGELLKKSGVEVVKGVKEKEALELIEPFLKWQKSSFVFFKLAQTLNGVITGGTISCEKSREYVHKLRDKIDLLVIGGNTVRVDRPTLDSRMIKGKAPDILIYSKRKDFDKNIPLFNVKNRKVFIDDSFEKLKNYRYIMIEGGEGMLEATKDIVDWYLFFVSANIKQGKNYQFDKKLKILNQRKIDKDLMIWSKNG